MIGLLHASVTLHPYHHLTPPQIQYTFFFFETAWVLLAFIEDKICNLFLGNREDKGFLTGELKKSWPDSSLIEVDHPMIGQLKNAADQPNEPLHIDLVLKGSPFQLKVWESLLEIGPAKVVSYEEIAQMLGNKKTVRAVGVAIGKNPVSLLIPCHRVIHKNGVIGQYRWGSEKKKQLIEFEKQLG